jgi:hypothetical protein
MYAIRHKVRPFIDQIFNLVLEKHTEYKTKNQNKGEQSMSKILKSFLSVCSVLAFSAIAISAPKAEAFSELGLKGKLQDVVAAYGWTCQGAPCNGVWKNQVATMTSLIDYVDAQIPDGTKLSESLGTLAKNTANKICTATATADYNTLQWLISTENRAVSRLVTLQELAGTKNIRKCSKVIQ